MKIFKLSLLALLSIVGVAMTSCSDDNNYAVGEPSEGAFFGETASTIEFDINKTSFPVIVSRTSAQSDATVSIAAEDNSGLFSVPSTATFNGSDLTTTIQVSYDPTKVEQDVNYSITLTVSPATEYGYSTYSFKAVSPSPWTTLGLCTFTDDMVAGLNGAPAITYKVAIQENDLTPGLYRLVNPYGKSYPYNEPGDYDTSKDYYMTIDATNPERVILERSNTGCDWGYGEMSVWSMAGYYLAKGESADDIADAGLFGVMENGVITWAPKSLIAIDDDGMAPVNASGTTRIIMPGVVLSDYSAEIEYAGRKVDTENKEFYIVDVTLGSDVANARVAVVLGEDVDEIADGVIDGTIESDEVSASQSCNIPVSDKTDGTYVFIVITYDKDGKVQDMAYQTVELKF
ncbi:MAG: hypothetical protein K2I94_03980 [Muribaculaceae bacterium]|nr:hypothetical protein [Muribaculaceae bacterium]